MALQKLRQTLSILSVVLLALALARLADAVGKRELLRAAREAQEEQERVRAEFERLVDEKVRLELDQQLLQQRLQFLSRSEHYLVVNRAKSRLQMGLGDKILLEVPFRLRGTPDGVDDFLSLPKGKFEILGRRENTDWYIPDWVYRLQGVEPPAESAARVIKYAFGSGELFLGGGISIHGPVREEVPEGAIDHTYIELDNKSLTAVVTALKAGSLVFID